VGEVGISYQLVQQFLDRLNADSGEEEILKELIKSIFLLPSDYSRPVPKNSVFFKDALLLLDESIPSGFRLESESQPEEIYSLCKEFRLASQQEEEEE
jgi:hypothetical protein